MARNILHFISSTHLMQICSQGCWGSKNNRPCFLWLVFILFIFEATDARWCRLLFSVTLRYISGDGLMSSQAQTLLYNCQIFHHSPFDFFFFFSTMLLILDIWMSFISFLSSLKLDWEKSLNLNFQYLFMSYRKWAFWIVFEVYM